ncbi:MAG: 6,7-dimethyl-8-ribityllumazine synthase [Kiritimatiellaceae bacterium]|nr:MAG: 6,7-dimethyl-8-ribityllumazine synthase [Kiritimatiellaceae bacterium]|tara:strand:- start:744 stop:1256 length:513 start_codon:yes stop_codon:yes gene_type:complete
MVKGIERDIGEIEGLEIEQRLGRLDGAGLRFGLVVARFNDGLTDELARQAVGALEACGTVLKAVELVRVPGAYEVPVVLEKMAASGQYDGLIALGVVVEGETQHAQMIIDTTGKMLLEISCRHGVPVINEIVGARSWEQAEARCLGGEQSRGWYAGLAAVETAQVLRRVR